MTSGRNSRKSAAKTLYDLFGVRPGVDDETLQSAFRDAAKANHPDLNPSDPDAPRRFRQITAAYAILRDAEHREAYDRLLDRQVVFERQQRATQRDRRTVESFWRFTAKARPPKGLLIDWLVPPDRAEHMTVALQTAFEERWVPKYGARRARRMFVVHSIGSIMGFWIDWLMKHLKLLKLFSGSGVG